MNDSSFSLKEAIIELRDEQKAATAAHIKMALSLEGIELQMKKFAVSMEDHEKRLTEQETFKTKAMVVWGGAVFIVSTVSSKLLALFSNN